MFRRRRSEGMDVTTVVYYVKRAILEAEKRQLLAKANTAATEKQKPGPFPQTRAATINAPV